MHVCPAAPRFAAAQVRDEVLSAPNSCGDVRLMATGGELSEIVQMHSFRYLPAGSVYGVSQSGTQRNTGLLWDVRVKERVFVRVICLGPQQYRAHHMYNSVARQACKKVF